MDSDSYQSHCLNEDILASLLEPELQAPFTAGPSPPYSNGVYSLDSTHFSQTLASPSPLSKSSLYGEEDEGFEGTCLHAQINTWREKGGASEVVCFVPPCQKVTNLSLSLDCPEDTLQGATDPTLAESGTISDLSLDNITAEFFPFGADDDLLKTFQTSELVDQGVAMEPDLTTCLDYNVGVSSPHSPSTTGIPSPAYSNHSPYHYSSYGQGGSHDCHVTGGYNSPVPSTGGVGYDTEMTNDLLYPSLSDTTKELSYTNTIGGLQLSDIDTLSFLAGSNVANSNDIHQQLLNYSDIPLNFGLTNNTKTDSYTYQAPPTNQCPSVPMNQTSSQTERRSPTPSGLGMSPANSLATEYTCTDSEGLDAPSPGSPTLYGNHTRHELIQMPYYEFKKILESPDVAERDKHSMKAVRKKGKNKDAARDCRKRKMEVVRRLEKDIKELKGQKTVLAVRALKLQRDIELSKRVFTSKLANVVH